jgi:hypothetical protein
MAGVASADLVLLDEYWTPEIELNGVEATVIDTQERVGEDLAKSGEFSALLENLTGWPNVRFRGAAAVTLEQLPPGDTEAGLWYRTDAWEGAWRLEIWVSHESLGYAPAKAMEAMLDAGGVDGALIADGEWHQARGALLEAGDYDRAPRDIPLPTYVWLVPLGGWDLPHKTYVDRIEATVVSGPLKGHHPAPEPARHVRPDPGAQVTGEGWVWWEGEDAISHNYEPGGPFGPDNAEAQAKLANGAWLQGADTETEAAWQVELPEGGEYHLWARGYWWLGGFAWRWDGGRARRCEPGMKLAGAEWLRWGAPVYWVQLGEVELSEGKHTLEVRALPEGRAHCFDCWVLSAEPFEPRSKFKPGEEAEPAATATATE